MSMIEENEKHKISCYKIKKPSHSDYIYLEEQKNNTISGNIIVIAILFIVFVLLPLTSFKREEGDIMYLLPLLGIFGWIVYQLSMDTVLTTKK